MSLESVFWRTQPWRLTGGEAAYLWGLRGLQMMSSDSQVEENEALDRGQEASDRELKVEKMRQKGAG